MMVLHRVSLVRVGVQKLAESGVAEGPKKLVFSILIANQ